MVKTLTNQVAIISGGLGDIGRAIAQELARRGADVAVGDVRPGEDAVALLASLREAGVRARYDSVDVADAAAVSEWVSAVEADLGPATLIVPNAAIVTLAGVRDVTPQQWSRELRVNLDGAFHLAHAAAMRLLAAKAPGRIVFLGSVAAHVVNPHIPAYCVAKAGLRMLCRCMALDLAPHGILVNEVAPGYVDAGVSAEVWRQDPPFKDVCRQHVPIGLLIEPGEVARQVAYLCEPENRHLTGTAIVMDGGITLVGPQRTRR